MDGAGWLCLKSGHTRNGHERCEIERREQHMSSSSLGWAASLSWPTTGSSSFIGATRQQSRMQESGILTLPI